MIVKMPYIYCIIVTLAKVAACVFLGWCVLQGATPWLIIVMFGLAIGTVFPAHDIFTCPKCGWVGEVKTYRAMVARDPLVQKEQCENHD